MDYANTSNSCDVVLKSEIHNDCRLLGHFRQFQIRVKAMEIGGYLYIEEGNCISRGQNSVRLPCWL